jgi:hypothetical protein
VHIGCFTDGQRDGEQRQVSGQQPGQVVTERAAAARRPEQGAEQADADGIGELLSGAEHPGAGAGPRGRHPGERGPVQGGNGEPVPRTDRGQKRDNESGRRPSGEGEGRAGADGTGISRCPQSTVARPVGTLNRAATSSAGFAAAAQAADVSAKPVMPAAKSRRCP